MVTERQELEARMMTDPAFAEKINAAAKDMAIVAEKHGLSVAAGQYAAALARDMMTRVPVKIASQSPTMP